LEASPENANSKKEFSEFSESPTRAITLSPLSPKKVHRKSILFRNRPSIKELKLVNNAEEIPA